MMRRFINVLVDARCMSSFYKADLSPSPEDWEETSITEGLGSPDEHQDRFWRKGPYGIEQDSDGTFEVYVLVADTPFKISGGFKSFDEAVAYLTSAMTAKVVPDTPEDKTEQEEAAETESEEPPEAPKEGEAEDADDAEDATEPTEKAWAGDSAGTDTEEINDAIQSKNSHDLATGESNAVPDTFDEVINRNVSNAEYSDAHPTGGTADVRIIEKSCDCGMKNGPEANSVAKSLEGSDDNEGEHKSNVEVPHPGVLFEHHYIDNHALGSARLMSDAPSLEAFEKSTHDFRSLMDRRNQRDCDLWSEETQRYEPFVKADESTGFREMLHSFRKVTYSTPHSRSEFGGHDRRTAEQKAKDAKAGHPDNVDRAADVDLDIDRLARDTGDAPTRVREQRQFPEPVNPGEREKMIRGQAYLGKFPDGTIAEYNPKADAKEKGKIVDDRSSRRPRRGIQYDREVPEKYRTEYEGGSADAGTQTPVNWQPVQETLNNIEGKKRAADVQLGKQAQYQSMVAPATFDTPLEPTHERPPIPQGYGEKQRMDEFQTLVEKALKALEENPSLRAKLEEKLGRSDFSNRALATAIVRRNRPDLYVPQETADDYEELTDEPDAETEYGVSRGELIDEINVANAEKRAGNKKLNVGNVSNPTGSPDAKAEESYNLNSETKETPEEFLARVEGEKQRIKDAAKATEKVPKTAVELAEQRAKAQARKEQKERQHNANIAAAKAQEAREEQEEKDFNANRNLQTIEEREKKEAPIRAKLTADISDGKLSEDEVKQLVNEAMPEALAAETEEDDIPTTSDYIDEKGDVRVKQVNAKRKGGELSEKQKAKNKASDEASRNAFGTTGSKTELTERERMYLEGRKHDPNFRTPTGKDDRGRRTMTQEEVDARTQKKNKQLQEDLEAQGIDTKDKKQEKIDDSIPEEMSSSPTHRNYQLKNKMDKEDEYRQSLINKYSTPPKDKGSENTTQDKPKEEPKDTEPTEKSVDDPSARSFRDMLGFAKAEKDKQRGAPVTMADIGHPMRDGRPIRELYRTVTIGNGKDCSSSAYDPKVHQTDSTPKKV